jgi:hypothetical protein
MKLYEKIAASYTNNQQSVVVGRKQLTHVELPSDKHPGFPQQVVRIPHRKGKS